MDHKRSVPLSWPVQPGTTATSAGRLSWCAAVARWAPSKHNTQPWRFVLQDEVLDVWTDPSRILANTDSHRREMLISCGAAVHFACVAARSLGYQPFVELLPRGAGGPAARLTAVGRCDVTDGVAARSLGYQPFVELLPRGAGGPAARLTAVGRCDVTDDDRGLLGAVRDRRTDRGPLDGDALPVGLPFLLQSAAAANGAELRLVSTPGDRATLAALVASADRLLVRTGHYDAELAPWLREPGDLRRDGVLTDHTRGAAASYRAEFVQRDFFSSTSQPARYQRRPDRPLLGVLSTQTDDPPSWLRAGQALGAVLLRAALAGAHASYLNQPVEHGPSRVLLHDQLELDGVAQLVLRIGVGSQVTPAARRGIDDVVFCA